MKKVITYGTFDLFHHGHYNIIKRAKELGDYLIVGVTGESYDLERGKINVRDSLIKRIENVRNTGLADQIIVEEYQGQKVDDILKYDIDTFVVGSDWLGKFDYLKNYCEVKYLERTKDISSTQVRNQESFYNIGIVTDYEEDYGIVYESKFVSGIHIDSVYSDTQEIGEMFAKKYEINKAFSDYSEFLKYTDIVYISVPIEKRYKLVNKALSEKKYVIVNSPISLNQAKVKELFEVAHSNNVLIIENIITAYLRAFNQLVWLINGGLIGKVVSLDAIISDRDFAETKRIEELLVYPLFFVSKLIHKGEKRVLTDIIQNDENLELLKSQIKYDGTVFNITVARNVAVESGLTIIGAKGKIIIDDDWWNTGYFEAWINGEKHKKRYCFNFEGNGFRYLLQELLIMIKEKRTECTRIFDKDSMELVKKIEDILK